MEFLNYNKSKQDRSCIGYASIAFRTEESYQTSCYKSFILNSKNDGWFRKDEGIADGFGLCINEFKITSHKPVTMGAFNVYKCKINYTDWAYDSEIQNDFFWLYVHENFDLEEIINYINENKESWYP